MIDINEFENLKKDAVKKLDKNMINLIEVEDLPASEVARLRKLIIRDHPEFKDKIIFFCGKFDIKYLSKQDLVNLKNQIEKLL